MFLRACAFYVRRSASNRVVATAKKLKRPKYVLGSLFVILYFWGIFFANPAWEGTSDPVGHRQNALWILGSLGILQLGGTWLGARWGVAFREPEVQFLFPRPFSRFQLLLFKWLTAQVPTLASASIIALFVTRYDGFSYRYVAAGLWLFYTLLSLHGILFGLYHSALRSRGAVLSNLRFAPIVLLALATPLCAFLSWENVGRMGGWEGMRALFDTEPMSWLIAPFEFMVAPVIAQDLTAFLAASAPIVVVLLAHLALLAVIRVPFEDQAVEIASKLQDLKRDGLSAFRKKKDMVASRPNALWRLAPTGPSWKALVWKNVISISRFPRRFFAIAFLVAVIVSFAAGEAIAESGEGPGRSLYGFVILAILGYLTVLGPAVVRVDLRIDIPHFDVLKSMPLRGRSLIFGEIMGSVVVLWAIQILVTTVAAVLITEVEGHVIGWADKLPAMGALLVAFFAVDFALLTSENLMALWLPGFVKLGRGVKTGLDQMGQNLLGALVRMFGLLILFLPAALLGTGAVFGGNWLELPIVLSVSLGVVIGSATLVVESLLLIQLSEGRYDRFDLSSEGAASES